MSEHGRVLAVVPARGGSKGIPLKNLLSVGGQTLLARTLELALDNPHITAVCVSTDHDQIKDAARGYDRVTVIDRPEDLSGDRVGDVPVLQHALSEMESSTGSVFDAVVMLQVTSPLRTAFDIRSCIELLSSRHLDAVWTVSPTELHYHPLKQLTIGDESQLSLYDERGIGIVARQELEPTFHRNGCCYVLRRDFLVSATSLYSPGATQAVISEGPRVNIDSMDDVAVAERLLSERGGWS